MTGTSGELGDLMQRGYRFALSLTHDSSRAEDLLQDAWFSVLRVKGPWSRSYLFRTVRNRFIDECRRDGRVGMETLQDHDNAEAAVDSQSWHDDDRVFATNGAFDRVLGNLRAEERAVLYLSAVEEYTAQQVADLLDWPRGTVLSMLHRTRGKLRQLLDVDAKELT